MFIFLSTELGEWAKIVEGVGDGWIVRVDNLEDVVGGHLMGFITCCMVWFNNTVYPSEFSGPTGPEASQAQSFTFLVRDQRLGSSIASAQAPTGLGKYLMRSPTGEIIRAVTLDGASKKPCRIRC